MRRIILRTLLVVSALAVISSCANFGYYAQSVGGQMRVLSKARPIEELLADTRTPPELGVKLRTALRIRDYATESLGLPDNDSYRHYADLERPYVLWNVFATPEFSTKLETWCFPIAGCVSYRGYFSESDAEAFAAELRERGYDAVVKGVPAYSTLGWLQDPVLNTVINRSEPDLAALLFHELAHQMVYLRDDSTFNESFATTVEIEGVRRWLEAHDGPGIGAKLAAYEKSRSRRADFVALLMRYRQQLDELFRSDLADAEKRAAKAATYAALKSDYQALKISWDGYAGYDRFFARDLNNASLASVAAYTDLVPGFQRLLAQHNGDLKAFYRAAKDLGRLPKAERLVRLQPPASVASEGLVP